jgi:hypothetical protein
MKQRMRPWWHAEGPRGFRVRVFEDRTSPNIMLDIRDWRRPNEVRYRTLSLGHNDRDRAIRHARVLSRYWRLKGRPPKMLWRRGRGPLPRALQTKEDQKRPEDTSPLGADHRTV